VVGGSIPPVGASFWFFSLLLNCFLD